MCWFTSIAPDFQLDKQWWNADTNTKKTSFSCPWQVSQSLNLLVFAVKSSMLHLCLDRHANTSQNSSGVARDGKCWTLDHGTDKDGKCPADLLVGGGHWCTCNWLMHHMFGNKPLHMQFVQFIIWTQGLLGAAIWEYYGIFRGGLLCSFVFGTSLCTQILLNFLNIIKIAACTHPQFNHEDFSFHTGQACVILLQD